jgi:hypothetical protein
VLRSRWVFMIHASTVTRKLSIDNIAFFVRLAVPARDVRDLPGAGERPSLIRFGLGAWARSF